MDVFDNFYPQAASQWDSLAHIGYAPDEMYNGATEQEVLAGTRNTIEHWARHGMAGRAVLLDAERAMRDAGRPYDPGGSTPIGVADLELARHQAGVEFAAGDVILLHTGFADCAADGVYEMFLVSAPMNAPGGIGSPANAVAIK